MFHTPAHKNTPPPRAAQVFNQATSVRYHGLFAVVVRTFETRERAEQWARQAGVFDRSTTRIG